MRANGISVPSLVVALSMGPLSNVEIKASRPCKELRRRWPRISGEEDALLVRYEAVLKSISLGVILLALGLLLWRATG